MKGSLVSPVQTYGVVALIGQGFEWSRRLRENNRTRDGPVFYRWKEHPWLELWLLLLLMVSVVVHVLVRGGVIVVLMVLGNNEKGESGGEQGTTKQGPHSQRTEWWASTQLDCC